MNKILISLGLMLLVFFSYGQSTTFQWAKQFTNFQVHLNSMASDNSGNVFTTGSFKFHPDFNPGTAVNAVYALGYADVFISKLDSNGNYAWAKRFGGSGGQMESYGLTLDNKGNIYTTGMFAGTIDFDPGAGTYNLTSSGYYDIFVAKLDSNGNFIWAKRMGEAVDDEAGMAIDVDNSGNVLTTGYFCGTSDFDPGAGMFNLTCSGIDDIFISKLDSNGNFIWAKKIGGSEWDVGRSIKTDNSGNVYTTGNFEGPVDFNPGTSVFLITPLNGNQYSTFISKLDSNGNFVMAKHFAGTSSAYNGMSTGRAIALDNSLNIYICGETNGLVDFDPGTNVMYTSGNGLFITKLDALGNLVWAKSTHTTSGGAIGNALTLDNLNNAYATGSFYGTVDFDPNSGTFNLSANALGSDIFTTKLDSNGNFKWASQMGGLNTVEEGKAIVVTTFNNVYTAGDFTEIGDYDPGTNVFNLVPIGSVSSAFIQKMNQCIATSSTISASACNSYTLNGQTYTASGTYNQQFINSVYCDSIVTLFLTLNSSTSVLNQNACNQFILNGQTYTTSGSYVQTLTNAMGCDSVITLNLGILNPTTSNVYHTACDTFTLNGQTYTTSGVYTQLLTNSVGCDSNLILHLSVNNSSASNLSSSSCDYFSLNGQTYTTSGVYTQSFTNAVGCDSTLTLNLNVNHSTYSILNQSTCDTFILNGQTYTNTGIYNQYLTNSIGCDSIITLNLTLNSSTYTLNQTACDSFIFNSSTHISSGIYIQPFVNSFGCDSIIVLNLIINSSIIHSITDTACDTFSLNGQTYNSSGLYTQTYSSSFGCDSLIVLNLVLNNSNTTNILDTACNSYIYNGQTYSTSGIYSQTYTNSALCDSTVILNLVINSVNTGVNQVGNILTANAIGAYYNWVNCPSYSLIAGANNQVFTATTNGSYAAVITQNGCTDTSSCYVVTGVGMKDNNRSPLIHIYPNPCNGQFAITSYQTLLNASLRILKLTGETVLTVEQLSGNKFEQDISALANGIYIIEVQENNEFLRLKLVKQ